MEALSLSHLNVASISAFVMNIVSSSDKFFGRQAVDRLLTLVGVTPCTGSSRIGWTTGGAGLRLEPGLLDCQGAVGGFVGLS